MYNFCNVRVELQQYHVHLILQDPEDFQLAYDAMFSFLGNPDNLSDMDVELKGRGVSTTFVYRCFYASYFNLLVDLGLQLKFLPMGRFSSMPHFGYILQYILICKFAP